ncbi:class I SAM-dependent methyltransferase [Virgibacillus oceani]
MAYKHMASVYDTFMADAPYDEWLEFTTQIINDSDRAIQSIIDLGCGTGEIALRLAEGGYQVTGVDYSSDMLTLAAHKANNKNMSIQWVHQDMRDLVGFADMDLVISYCDAINYITTEKELSAVFHRVADALKPGGQFIFDVHSLHHLEHQLMNQTFADVTEDTSYIWFCTRGDAPGEVFHEITFFSLEGGTYIRFDELHHQRTFSIEIYKKLLADAGFRNIKLYGDFSLKNGHPKEDTERIFFLAENSTG